MPNVIGIGARKCGTGILQAFLGKHPLVQASVRETHYYDRNRGKGLEYYRFDKDYIGLSDVLCPIRRIRELAGMQIGLYPSLNN